MRPDANIAFAVENIVDAGFFNSGQSCCAVERIYVHEAVYDAFVEARGRRHQRLHARLADRSGHDARARSCAPRRPISCAARSTAAKRQGAKPLIDESRFAEAAAGTPYLAPQLLVDVDHSMAIMTEETFGPAHRRHEGEIGRGGHRA